MKKDGLIKAQAFTDGRKQRACAETTETPSPIVITESIFTTAPIDAKEGRDVTIFVLPGAFLHAHNDEKVIMFMKGELAELMVHIAPHCMGC